MPKLKEPSQKQLEFVRWYTNPASPTFDNVTQSAIRAGYTKKYAQAVAYKTLKPIAKRMVLDAQAKKVGEEVDRGQFYQDLLRDAEKGIAERVRMNAGKDSKMIAIQQKDQHLVAETLGKDRWSKRTEVENRGYIQLDSVVAAKLAGGLLDDDEILPEKPTYKVLEAKNENDQAETDKNDDTQSVKNG